MNVKEPDKIRFACAYCDCSFSIDTGRAAAAQDVVCPNCQKTFEVKATTAIGKAVRNLFGTEPVGFSWWLE